MSSFLPDSIDLRITGKCNLNCRFCFGTRIKKEADLDNWLYLLDEFKKYGVKKLVITGGEPTLYKDLLKFLEHAKKLNFRIVLSTNGTKFLSHELLKNIDILSLPLDGHSYHKCNEMRGLSYEDYLNIFDSARNFKKLYPYKQLKIGTVVTRENIYKIEKIIANVIEFADVWKLYQVSKHSNNINIFEKYLEVTDKEFEEIYERLYSKYGTKIKIVVYRNRERNGKYLFCEPNGDAIVISNDVELRIGNFFEGFNQIVEIWPKYVDIDLLNNNFNETYQ